MMQSLEGVRVLELARFQAAPRGGMMMSDLGAEVIKIEALGGEETRKNPPMVRGQSVYFTVYNRGKKSICMDMRTPQGKDIFAELVKHADIVLENFRPGTMETMASIIRSSRPSTRASSSCPFPVSASTGRIATGRPSIRSARR
jgi:crotonobetainyl-CoA:carnitine CoA-transferase CaiB-like acyl-CoA transferase